MSAAVHDHRDDPGVDHVPVDPLVLADQAHTAGLLEGTADRAPTPGVPACSSPKFARRARRRWPITV